MAEKKWYLQSGPQGDVIVSSHVRLARDLQGRPFPCRANAQQAEQVCDLVADAVSDLDAVKLFYIKMSDLTADRVVSLAEKHLISPAFAEPAPGKAILLSENEDVCIMLCEEDHIRLQVFRAGFALREALDKANAIDDHLDKKLEYAFDDRLGYLTQRPTDLGTAMRASVMMHLPALGQGNEISRLAATVAKLGLKLRGPFDDGGAKGDLYRLSNRLTFGISERSAIDNLSAVALQLATRERAAREELQKDINFTDKIHRAYGILCSARVITSDEMNEMLSYLRLGAVFGELPVRLETINYLSSTLQPATMNAELGEGMTVAQRDALRAQIVKDRLLADAEETPGK